MDLRVDHQASQAQLEKELEASAHVLTARGHHDRGNGDLFEFVPSACFALAGDGRIVEVNSASAALLGVPRQELMDTPLARFVAGEHLAVFEETWRSTTT